MLCCKALLKVKVWVRVWVRVVARQAIATNMGPTHSCFWLLAASAHIPVTVQCMAILATTAHWGELMLSTHVCCIWLDTYTHVQHALTCTACTVFFPGAIILDHLVVICAWCVTSMLGSNCRLSQPMMMLSCHCMLLLAMRQLMPFVACVS